MVDAQYDRQAQLAVEIREELSRCALAVGAMLEEAFEVCENFEHWVEDELPLSVRTAERLRAMAMVHADRPNAPDLPEPWKALAALA